MCEDMMSQDMYHRVFTVCGLTACMETYVLFSKHVIPCNHGFWSCYIHGDVYVGLEVMFDFRGRSLAFLKSLTQTKVC